MRGEGCKGTKNKKAQKKVEKKRETVEKVRKRVLSEKSHWNCRLYFFFPSTLTRGTHGAQSERAFVALDSTQPNKSIASLSPLLHSTFV